MQGNVNFLGFDEIISITMTLFYNAQKILLVTIQYLIFKIRKYIN